MDKKALEWSVSYEGSNNTALSKKLNRKYLESMIKNQKTQWELNSFVQDLLERNNSWVEDLILDIRDISENAISQNAKWDIIPDAKARLSAKKMLLEMAGIYKPKQVDVKINLLQYVYGQ